MYVYYKVFYLYKLNTEKNPFRGSFSEKGIQSVYTDARPINRKPMKLSRKHDITFVHKNVTVTV